MPDDREVARGDARHCVGPARSCASECMRSEARGLARASCQDARALDRRRTGLLCRRARRSTRPIATTGPRGAEPDLIVVHGISLPPGEFGGPWIDRLFTNALPPDAHPYFATIAASARLVARADPPRRHAVQYVPFQRARLARGRPRAGAVATRCNDFSVGIELEGTDDAPYDDRQYEALARCSSPLCARLSRARRRRSSGTATSRRAQDRPGPGVRLAAARARPARARRGVPARGAGLKRMRASPRSRSPPARRKRPRPRGERIVSVAPNLTEMLFAAGAAEQVVAVSAYSDYPEAATKLPQVGDAFRLDYERIVALRRPSPSSGKPARRPASPSASRGSASASSASRPAAWTTSRPACSRSANSRARARSRRRRPQIFVRASRRFATGTAAGRRCASSSRSTTCRSTRSAGRT